MRKERSVHPWIPNSAPRIRDEMLREIGASSIDELYELIPEPLRFKGKLNLPDPLPDEASLDRHMRNILGKNVSTAERLSFLGGGCAPHYVPAVCDWINQRSEFLTAYAGEPYEDHGRFQVLFEYASMIGDLVGMDAVSVPTYDGSQAAASALRMAGRITGRKKALIPEIINPDRRSIIGNYSDPKLEVDEIGYDERTGLLDVADLERKLGPEVAAVYFEVPGYLGTIEPDPTEITRLAHAAGALVVVGVDPISLGVLAAPADYGADIVVGELQPLGVQMQFGGGRGGFIATPDDERHISEYPLRLFGIAPTVDQKWGFGDVAWERTSFAKREGSKEFVGTMAALWGITAGVYLALMGPAGMRELGETILARAAYAAERLNGIPGVRAPRLRSPFFKEFTVDFSETGLTVAAINEQLLERGIFGGHDLSSPFPELVGCALYCVTEVHTKDDIDRLVGAVSEVVKEGR